MPSISSAWALPTVCMFDLEVGKPRIWNITWHKICFCMLPWVIAKSVNDSATLGLCYIVQGMQIKLLTKGTFSGRDIFLQFCLG